MVWLALVLLLLNNLPPLSEDEPRTMSVANEPADRPSDLPPTLLVLIPELLPTVSLSSRTNKRPSDTDNVDPGDCRCRLYLYLKLLPSQ